MWHTLKHTLGRNIGFAILLSLFTVSVFLNVALGLRVGRSSHAQAPASIANGADARTLSVLDEKGASHELHLGNGRPTILYIMSPTCHWCALNLENIRTLAYADASRYQFIGISNTGQGLTKHLAAKPLPFPVYVADMSNLPKGIDVGSTPQMALVGPDGVVKKVWIGALTKKYQADVESFFHTKLPGLLKPSDL